MKTRKDAIKRSLELYPKTHIETVNQLHEVSRDVYLQCFDDMQIAEDAKQAAVEVDNDKLRKAAEKVVKFWKMNPSLVDDWERDMDVSVEKLEKALK